METAGAAAPHHTATLDAASTTSTRFFVGRHSVPSLLSASDLIFPSLLTSQSADSLPSSSTSTSSAREKNLQEQESETVVQRERLGRIGSLFRNGTVKTGGVDGGRRRRNIFQSKVIAGPRNLPLSLSIPTDIPTTTLDASTASPITTTITLVDKYPIVISLFVPSRLLTCSNPSKRPQWPALNGLVLVTRHSKSSTLSPDGDLLPNDGVGESTEAEEVEEIDRALKRAMVHVEVQCILVHKSPIGTIFEKTLYAESKLLKDAASSMTPEIFGNCYRRELPFNFNFGSRALPPSFLLPDNSSSPAIVPPSSDVVARDPYDGGLTPGVHWRLIAYITANPSHANEDSIPLSPLSNPLNGGLRSLARPSIAVIGGVVRRPLIKTSLNLIVGYGYNSVEAGDDSSGPLEGNSGSSSSSSSLFTAASSTSPSLRSTISVSYPAKSLSSELTLFPSTPPPQRLTRPRSISFTKAEVPSPQQRTGTIRIVSVTPHEGDSTVSIILNFHRDILNDLKDDTRIFQTTLDIQLHQIVKLRRPGNRSTLLRRCVVGGIKGLDLAAAAVASGAVEVEEWVLVEVDVPMRGGIVDMSGWEGGRKRQSSRGAIVSSAGPSRWWPAKMLALRRTASQGSWVSGSMSVCEEPNEVEGVEEAEWVTETSGGEVDETRPKSVASSTSTVRPSRVQAYTTSSSSSPPGTPTASLRHSLSTLPRSIKTAFRRRSLTSSTASTVRASVLGRRKSVPALAVGDMVSTWMQLVPSTPEVVSFGNHVAVETSYGAVVKILRGVVEEEVGRRSGEGWKRFKGGKGKRVEETIKCGFVVGSPEVPVIAEPTADAPQPTPTQLSQVRSTLSLATLNKSSPGIFRSNSAIFTPSEISGAVQPSSTSTYTALPSPTTTLTQPDFLAPLLSSTLDDIALTVKNIRLLEPAPPSGESEIDDWAMHRVAQHASVLMDLVDTFDIFLARTFVETWGGAGGLAGRGMSGDEGLTKGSVRRGSYSTSFVEGGQEGAVPSNAVPWPRYLEPFNHIALEMELLLGVPELEALFAASRASRSGCSSDDGSTTLASDSSSPRETAKSAAVDPLRASVSTLHDTTASQPQITPSLITKSLEYLDAVRSLILAWTASRGVPKTLPVSRTLSSGTIRNLSSSASGHQWFAALDAVAEKRNGFVEVLGKVLGAVGVFEEGEEEEEEDDGLVVEGFKRGLIRGEEVEEWGEGRRDTICG
ncbi:hypothetical protein HDU67_006618 [Dinochytrium kinnereticum]|nr:hypothetical protein HDU67_006618 [Dinochytrium kinnereticum]